MRLGTEVSYRDKSSRESQPPVQLGEPQLVGVFLGKLAKYDCLIRSSVRAGVVLREQQRLNQTTRR